MKYSYLLIHGLLLAFNAHASNPGEEFKDTPKKSWTAQLPTIHSSQMVNSETEDDIDSPNNQLIANIAEKNALLQMQEQKNKNLRKQLEETKIRTAQRQKEIEDKQTLEALQQRMAIEKQEEQRLKAEIAALEANETSTLQQANNNQNVPNTNSAIIVSSAKSQYDPGYESSAEFSDFEEDLSYKPADPRFTATVIEEDNNQNVQPIIQAPVVTSIENDNVTTATNVNHQPGLNVNNEPEFELTGEGIARLLRGDKYKKNDSNFVNLRDWLFK